MHLLIYLLGKKKKVTEIWLTLKVMLKLGKNTKRLRLLPECGRICVCEGCKYFSWVDFILQSIWFHLYDNWREMVIENRALSHAVSKAFLMIKCHHISRVPKILVEVILIFKNKYAWELVVAGHSWGLEQVCH